MAQTACSLPREMAAAALQRAMTRGRDVKLTLTGPAHIGGGRVDVVGEVVALELGGRDPLSFDDLTVTIVEHPRPGIALATPPIALDRIRSVELI